MNIRWTLRNHINWRVLWRL